MQAVEVLKEFLGQAYFGVTLFQLFGAALSILLGFILKPFILYLLSRLQKLTAKTKTELDDILIYAIERPLGLACLVTGVAVALIILPLPEVPVNIHHFVMAVFKSLYIILAIWFSLRLIDRLCELWSRKATRTDTVLDDQVVPVVRNASQTFMVIIGGVVIVQSLGYSVTSLVAGLGIGGAALALASKDTIANLFGSIVIFLDRPFHVGDWVEIGANEGTVEEVGMRTTRIRTFANSLITIPNSQLTTSAINNWSRMKKRRIKTTIGLTYDTPPEKVDAAVTAIREIIAGDERFHQDFSLVNFNNLSAYSLDIFIYCFTVTTNWAEHLQVRQEFLLKIMKAVSDLGCEFAFPTQTLHLGGEDVEEPPGVPQSMTKDLPS